VKKYIVASVVFVIIAAFLAKHHKPIYTSIFCPNSESLSEGYIYTMPIGRFEMEFPYRRLEGFLIAKKSLSGATISYAGLFTHKYWEKGQLIQLEEPTTDMSELFKFEAGTKHEIKTIRYNPQEPARKWHINSTYSINSSAPIELGWCSYSGVNIHLNQTISYPDGKVKTKNKDIKYIPELMIMSYSSGPRIINITKVRKKKLSEKQWPFTSDAHSWLNR
jgi:hypothetical protein